MGGSLERFSIILMGLSPYINASIILQLLSVVVPKLEEIKKEGAQGQKKINTYTRILTVPLAFIQSYGMISS
jgi:preprotein translocase subunit SecY